MIKQNMNAFRIPEYDQRPVYGPPPPPPPAPPHQRHAAYDEPPEQDFNIRSVFAVLMVRAWTILGGSTEVQKNILSKAVLGL